MEKNEIQKKVNEREEGWFAKMNELENLWLTKMADARIEYQDVFRQVTKKRSESDFP